MAAPAAAAAAVPSTAHLLTKLRSLMQVSSVGLVHAYIVPSGDAHLSEYIADCDMRRQFISKFTGSAGTAVITLDKAALWTDGRYHLQASQQLDLKHWILMKDGLPDTPTQSDWLRDVLEPGSKVGVDPHLLSHDTWKNLSKGLKMQNITLVAVKENLIDQVWADKSVLRAGVDTERPPRPCNKLINLTVELTGKSWETKVTELRQELTKKKASSVVLTALDEIAWLLNVRGSDIDFNPVFFAYCIVTMNDVYLFIDKDKLTQEVEHSLRVAHVTPATAITQQGDGQMSVKVMPYETIVDYLSNYLVPNERSFIWVSNRSSEAIVSCIPREKRYLAMCPVTKQKAIKNEVEVEHMRQCHIRDAAALCEYLAWLEETIEANPNGNDQLWEIEGATYLENCRRQQDKFIGLSFPSISASGPHGAIIHYHPEPATRRPISKKELYLIDSGAQYLDGTTDVTRTVHFGEPSAKERECFTMVLKGHIQLALAVFPRLAKGSQLDGFARRSLWSYGLEYLHGTGHGVGMFLNVHEGPSSISPRMSPDDPGLESGQILSNEPGYYEPDSFGIRIENLVVTRKAETKYNFNNHGFLKFDTITLVPIQLKMIDTNLLTDEEISWLNSYHSTCMELVGAHLDKTNKPKVKEWLARETRPLSR